MGNFVLDYNSFFKINESELFEMASTLSRLPIPKKMVSAIHRLSSEDVKPFTYKEGRKGGEQDWRHGGDAKKIGSWRMSDANKKLIDKISKEGVGALTDEEKEKVTDAENNAAAMGFRNISHEDRAILIASKTYKDPGVLPHDVDVIDPAEKFPELVEERGVKLLKDENGMPYARFKKTRLLGNMYDMPVARQRREGRRKDPGFLANISNTPWGGMRMLLAVPDANRYDYVYFKGRAFYGKDERGGKKYRVVTMDEDGNLIRDWMAYQGKIKFPEEVGGGESRDDFKNFPSNDDGYINVYFLDVEDTSAQEKREKRVGARKVTNKMFLETFKVKFENIIESIYGNKKDRAKVKLAEILGDISYEEARQALEGDAREEMMSLKRFIDSEDGALRGLGSKYAAFLKYMKRKGSYYGIQDSGSSKDDWKELSDIAGGFGHGTNVNDYASIEDIIDIHTMGSALRKFAEFILTGEVDDVWKEMDVAIGDFEEVMGDDDEDLLDMAPEAGAEDDAELDLDDEEEEEDEEDDLLDTEDDW